MLVRNPRVQAGLIQPKKLSLCQVQTAPIQLRRASLQKCKFTGLADPVDVNVVNLDGNELAKAQMSLRVSFDCAKHLVHRALVQDRTNKRQGTASTKGKWEVRGGGRKPWKQKGSGRARHGSMRSPIFRGGGVIHGPKPRVWNSRMDRKQRQIAVGTALQNAAENGDIIVVPSMHDFFLKDQEDGQSYLNEALVSWGMERADDSQSKHNRCMVICQHLYYDMYQATVDNDDVYVNDVFDIKVEAILNSKKIFIEAPAFRYIQRMFSTEHYQVSRHDIQVLKKPVGGLIRADFKPFDADGSAEYDELIAGGADEREPVKLGTDVDIIMKRKEAPDDSEPVSVRKDRRKERRMAKNAARRKLRQLVREEFLKRQENAGA